MGMYVERTALDNTRNLNQGDVLLGMLRPKTPTGKNFCLRQGSKFVYPAPPETLAQIKADLRVATQPERIDALVISNSCDNAAGDNPLLLVPIQPFKLNNEWPEHEQWRAISTAATGTANPKIFYLPAQPDWGLHQRCEAQLHLIFSVSHEFLARCLAEAGTTRPFGLTDAAVRHLQWAIGVVFSRDPREDYEWPSPEDLKLKLAFYDYHIEAGTRRHDEYVQERTRVRQLLGLDSEPQERRTDAPADTQVLDGVIVVAAGESAPVPESEASNGQGASPN